MRPPRAPSASRSSSSAMSLIACRWRWCSCCLPGGAMSGCQRFAIRRRASCTSRTSNGASISRSAIACSRSKRVAIGLTLANVRGGLGGCTTPANVGRRVCCDVHVAGEYIFQTYKLAKVHPPDREVLKDISLSFMHGAKIGVLGYNGSGKSSLLAIMAGRDREFRGDAALAPGASVGILEQEPALDETRDVRDNVLDGVGHLRALVERFNELAANYSDETADE